ncbi:B3 domain-containing protein Os11g0197600-like [Lolium rigidum]|uniref:B3 domain-containing protein Os11g0197600-like n=1 Tax=Lolium rigidum TaxID=89674 RepID=UPI001F5C1392|nr:B3 domain-containing protein Os11g0197600-like [Lolium rigidum]
MHNQKKLHGTLEARLTLAASSLIRWLGRLRAFLEQRVPPAFCQYLQNHPTGLISLKGQSGNAWPAKLSSDTEGLFFGNGWKEFVIDHSIESGHILTFSYDGHSQFSVVVFDGLCIEKSSAFNAKPSNNLFCIIETDEDDNDISAASVHYNSLSLNSTEDSDSPNRVLEESVPHKDYLKFSPMFRISKEVMNLAKLL